VKIQEANKKIEILDKANKEYMDEINTLMSLIKTNINAMSKIAEEVNLEDTNACNDRNTSKRI